MKLNLEQQKIIEFEPNGHMMIKGVAGSGKTTVAIHRMAFLKEHYCPEPNDNILFVTYNKTLLKYIDYQYTNVANETIMAQNLFASQGKEEISTIDKLAFAYFRRYCRREKVNYQIANTHKVRQVMQQAILYVQDKYEDVPIISLKYQDFLADEIEWIKSCNIRDEQTYQTIDRTGRSEGGSGNPQKLLKNSKTREAIYYLRKIYDNLLIQANLIDFATMNILALIEVEEVNHRKYTHILIDESQDLSKVQLLLLRQLHHEKKYASILFVADNTQSIYSRSWLGKGRAYTTIGYDMVGKSRTLSKNYRTTTEISKAAYSLIEHDEHIHNNIDFVKPALIDKHGPAPVYRYYTTKEEQYNEIVAEINALQQDYELKDICIIARENRLLEEMAQTLKSNNVGAQILRNEEPDFAANSVKLTSMHSIKGLEFKVVFLIHLDEGIIPNTRFTEEKDQLTEERKLLYVGMTRANERLYMSAVNKPSRFLQDIDNDHLRFKPDSKLRPFTIKPIETYVKTNKIADINSKEEIVRQWLTAELKEQYGYPLELMTFEYPVQQFSQRGYVDIAIEIDREGTRIPYIFIEVKSFATGIDIATQQLTTYMQTNEHVQYGITTDGKTIKIIDRKGRERQDIPPCQPIFLPNEKQTYTYTNYRNHKTYEYIQDTEEHTQIDIIDKETNLYIEAQADNPIPLIGDVAAGIPTTATEQYETTIMLPRNFIIDPDNTFALRVTGDSMINAGIEKGDIAIINKQTTAENSDIVIAIIGDEATMKKYIPMDSSVLLMSENNKYEPIHMDATDVKINGKVIGILKQ